MSTAIDKLIERLDNEELSVDLLHEVQKAYFVEELRHKLDNWWERNHVSKLGYLTALHRLVNGSMEEKA